MEQIPDWLGLAVAFASLVTGGIAGGRQAALTRIRFDERLRLDRLIFDYVTGISDDAIASLSGEVVRAPNSRTKETEAMRDIVQRLPWTDRADWVVTENALSASLSGDVTIAPPGLVSSSEAVAVEALWNFRRHSRRKSSPTVWSTFGRIRRSIEHLFNGRGPWAKEVRSLRIQNRFGLLDSASFRRY